MLDPKFSLFNPYCFMIKYSWVKLNPNFHGWNDHCFTILSIHSTAKPPRSRPHHLEAAERLAAPRAGVDIFQPGSNTKPGGPHHPCLCTTLKAFVAIYGSNCPQLAIPPWFTQFFLWARNISTSLDTLTPKLNGLKSLLFVYIRLISVFPDSLNRYLKFVQMNMKILRFPQTWVQGIRCFSHPVIADIEYYIGVFDSV